MSVRNLSIKYKFLFAMVLFMALFTFVITQLWNSRVSKDAESSALSYMSELIRVSTDNLEVALHDIDHIVAMISANQEVVIEALSAVYETDADADIVKDNRRIDGLISNELNFKRYLSGITVSDIKGRSFAVGDTLRFDALKKLPWYASIYRSKGEKLIIGPYSVKNNVVTMPDPDSKNAIISIIRPIIKDSAPIGFAKADIQFDLLLRTFHSNLKGNASIMIVDSSANWVLKPAGVAVPTLARDFLKLADAESGVFHTRIDNEPYIIFYSHSFYTNWTTFGLIPKQKLLEDFNGTRKTILWITLLISCAALAILFIFISLLTRNLLLLSKAMKNTFKSGSLDIAIRIQGTDEVGQLYLQFNQMITRIKELIVNTKRNEQEKRKAEIKALQAQINPHFLHNTLNTIKFLANLQGSAGISDVSESLSTLMRINMDRREFITIAEEVAYLNSYLRVQEYKYTNKFISHIYVEPGLEAKYILKLLLQPLVENALIHGIAPMKGQGILSIKLFEQETQLRIRVEDNGVGIREEKLSRLLDIANPHESIGLHNVMSRIKMYFEDEGDVKILSEEGYFTTIEIRHPLLVEPEVNAVD